VLVRFFGEKAEEKLLAELIAQGEEEPEVTRAQVLAAINAMDDEAVTAAVEALDADTVIELYKEIRAIERAVEKKLTTEEAQSLVDYGVFAVMSDLVKKAYRAVTAEPTEAPTEEPTTEPTEAPTEEPTAEPTEAPTEEPTAEPTEAPTEEPTAEPTEVPTEEPTAEPTEAPTAEPTEVPTEEPTVVPTEEPSTATDLTPAATTRPPLMMSTGPKKTPEPVDEHAAALEEVQGAIDAFLLKHFGDTTGWVENDFGNAIMGLYYEGAPYEEMLADYEALKENIAHDILSGELTDEELSQIDSTGITIFDSVLSQIIEASNMVMTLADNVTGIPTGLSISSSLGNMTGDAVSGLKATAKGSKGDFAFSLNPPKGANQTNTITLKNSLGKKATIKFHYVIDKADTYKVDGKDAPTSGDIQQNLDIDGTIVFSITSLGVTWVDNPKTATLTISGVTFAECTDTIAKFEFDDSLGKINYTSVIEGTTPTNGTITKDEERIVAANETLVLTAEPNPDATFIGWYRNGETLLTKEKKLEFSSGEDVTIQAVFADGVFMVGRTFDYTYTNLGNNKVFVKLDDAAAAAGSGGVVVLMKDYTLPAGTHTVPAGVTLLIPFDEANTLVTEKPTAADSAPGTYTAYRTLTMASGAAITVNGAISLAANISSKSDYNGMSLGAKNSEGKYTSAVSHIQMENGSSITINKDGKLYAWGFIKGSGEVIANSGAIVYETFCIKDWRGGSATVSMSSGKNGVFPMSQYCVPNVQVPLKLYGGAQEYTRTAVTIGSPVGIQDGSVPFIASDGLFRMAEGAGYVVKRTNGTTTDVTIYGSSNISPISVSMKLAVLGTTTIESGKFELPINRYMTITVASGTVTLNQDLALHPGSKITVNEGAKCVLGDGVSIYAYDTSKITAANVHGAYADPGVDASIVVNGTVDASKGYVYATKIGENGEGLANITSTKGTGVVIARAGTQANTHQSTQGGSDGTVITDEAIPIVNADLKNSDGTYTDASMVTDRALTFKYVEGKWVHDCDADETWDTGVVTAPTCTEAGYTTYKCTIEKCAATKQAAPVEALGHDKVHHDAQAPTCTEVGWDAYETCSRCDYTTYAEIKALDHDWKLVSNSATCTEPGKKYFVCGRSEYCFEDKEEEAEALGHTLKQVEAQDPTCTEVGWDDYEYCSVCDYTTYEEKGTVDHSYGEVITSAPTCTEEGVKTFTCGSCGDSYTETVNALGHKSDTRKEDVVEATCTAEGSYTLVTYCTVCKEVLDKKENQELAKTDHVYESVVYEPSCTEAAILRILAKTALIAIVTILKTLPAMRGLLLKLLKPHAKAMVS